MKNKDENLNCMRIRVFLPVVIACLVMWLVGNSLFVYFMIGDWQDYNWFSWFMIACLESLPSILLLWCIWTMSNVIEFDETGVRRIRFGRVIRNFSWEKVKTISCTAKDSWTGWVYISEQEKKYDNGFFSSSKMQLDRQVIYFHMSQKGKKALQKYAPTSLKANWMVEEGK